MFTLLSKYNALYLIAESQQAFEIIKEELITTLVLQGIKWDIPFHNHTDSFNKALGAFLGQQEDKIPFAIYFISKILSGAKMNYTIIERVPCSSLCH
jgi:hypothetical protein